MKKILKGIFKGIVISLLTIVVLLATVLIYNVYGWRLFGFTFCAPPDQLIIEDVVVAEDHVSMQCTYYFGAPSLGMKGHPVCKIDGTTVKIGFGHTSIIDIFIYNTISITEHTSVRIPKGTEIDKVVLCGGGDERVIWTREEGNIN